MNIPRLIKKPEYFFRPTQVFRRLLRGLNALDKDIAVKTPWNSTLIVNSQETIGRSLSHMGVYDLALSECLWRLVKPQDSVVDVGANIGYFSDLLGYRCGSGGRVFSFEPHPEIYARLEENLRNRANIVMHPLALSEKSGTMELYVPSNFSGNEGISSLEETPDSRKISVPVARLDEVLPSECRPRIMKIDVEGHEGAVLSGAQKTLQSLEHVLFEDFSDGDSLAMECLREAGFVILRLKKDFYGPSLVSIEEGLKMPKWEPPNYLATKDLDGARTALAPRGWLCLSVDES